MNSNQIKLENLELNESEINVEKDKKDFEASSPLHSVIMYAKSKAEYRWWKKIIFGFMSGIFVGFGYLSYFLIVALGDGSATSNILTTFFGAAIFPVGIICIIFLGGNLFTSNCLISLCLHEKIIKLKSFASDLVITFLSNLLGALFFGVLIGTFAIYSSDISVDIIELATKKLAATANYSIFYGPIFSGFFCNILVAGSIFAYVILGPRKGLGTFVVYIIIFAFSILGFQHVVANMVLFSMASFSSLATGIPLGSVTDVFVPGSTTELIDFHTVDNIEDFFFRIFVLNIPLVTIGNFAGGVFISEVYFMAEMQKLKKIKGIDVQKQINLYKGNRIPSFKKKSASDTKLPVKKPIK